MFLRKLKICVFFGEYTNFKLFICLSDEYMIQGIVCICVYMVIIWSYVNWGLDVNRNVGVKNWWKQSVIVKG